jgi:hypothetical protein
VPLTHDREVALRRRVSLLTGREEHLIAWLHHVDPRSAVGPRRQPPPTIHRADRQDAGRRGRVLGLHVASVADGRDDHDPASTASEGVVDDLGALHRSVCQAGDPGATERGAIDSSGDRRVGGVEVLVQHADRQQRRARSCPAEVVIA